MPYFNRAYQPHVQNSTLFDVAGHLHYTVNQTHGTSNSELIVQQAIYALQEISAIDAIHNSQERFPPPKCHPETRKIILAQIIAWVEERVHSLSGNQNILWLHGPAGAGKSAIAQTIAEIFEEPNRTSKIAASFFFTRGRDRCETVAHFVATIAYQMATSIPEMRDYIGTAVAHNPAILHLSLEAQIRRLIIEPFRSLLSRIEPHTLSQQRYLVVIDGLDECNGDENQKLIISHVANLLLNHNLPFIFLIASRPEPQIANSFRKHPQLPGIMKELHLGPSGGDIRTFLIHSFHEMQNSHPTLASVREPWPSQSDIDKLVHQSSGHFIYVSTVIRFIGDEDMRPAESLELVLSAAPNPFSALDTLYSQILSTVPQHKRRHLMSILEMLMVGRVTPMGLKESPEGFEQLLELPAGEVHVILRRMHSLLEITDRGISPHHASFTDYLGNKERSGTFYADSRLGHAKFAKATAKLLRTTYPSSHVVRDLSFHLRIASCQLDNDVEFLENLQAVSIGSWNLLSEVNQCITPAFEILERWIDSLESLASPPINIIQQFLTIIHRSYLRSIESGWLLPLPCFEGTKQMNPPQFFGNYYLYRVPHAPIVRAFGITSFLRSGSSRLKLFLEQSKSWKHRCDPILGHAVVVEWCLKELEIYGVENDYFRKWWTFHLAQCSPRSPSSMGILSLLGRLDHPRTDIHGSNRVIEWLKSFPDSPETLISHWEEYRQSLIIQSRSQSNFLDLVLNHE